jgi:hypothetical protein
VTIYSIIGAIAGVCSLAGFIPYWWAIWQGRTRPNRATWWIWLVVGIIIAASYRAVGASATIWVPLSYVVGPFVTSLLGIKFGQGGWTRFDRFCLLTAALSLVLWRVSSSPDLALAINIGIDVLGALPTIRKSLSDPYTEDLLAWLLFFVANTLNVVAIERWNWQVAIYPVYMFCITSTIFWVLWQGRRKGRKSI